MEAMEAGLSRNISTRLQFVESGHSRRFHVMIIRSSTSWAGHGRAESDGVVLGSEEGARNVIGLRIAGPRVLLDPKTDPTHL